MGTACGSFGVQIRLRSGSLTKRGSAGFMLLLSKGGWLKTRPRKEGEPELSHFLNRAT